MHNQQKSINFAPMIESSSIDSSAVAIAYSFFHQKWRVYEFSPYDWQRDDIEQAIHDYVMQMSPELYQQLCQQCQRLESLPEHPYLITHNYFAKDLKEAVEFLEKLL